MSVRISSVMRIATVGVLSLALSGCYGWGHRHHPYGWHGGPGYGHPGPGGPGPGYYH